MADISLRFNKDLLVLSPPISAAEMALLIEPEIYDDIYALDVALGVQCLVADTATFTPARLAHARLEDSGEDLARAALDAACGALPQHVLVELEPCGLPLDVSSKASLLETRDQYVRAAGYFASEEDRFDAYFLNGFETCTELKCALMGLRKVSDKPIFASVNVCETGDLAGGRGETLQDAVAVMAEYGAQVAGFATAAGVATIAKLVSEISSVTSELPIMVQFFVNEVNAEQQQPTFENPYYDAETVADGADVLAARGVQFFRAIGAATPAYTAALVGATLGDAVSRECAFVENELAERLDPMSIADALRERVNAAIAGN